MEFDDELEDGEAPAALLPPDDRLWRHPSEIGTLASIPPSEAWHRTFEPRFWTIVAVAGAVGALLGTGATFAVGGHKTQVAAVPGLDHRNEATAVERVVETTAPSVAGGFGVPALPGAREFKNLSGVVGRIRPAVVGLETGGPGPVVDGSAVVFRSDGYALTSAAVVAGATSMVAVMADGRRLAVRSLGTDPETGVAVVKIDGAGFEVAAFGSSTSLQLDQPLVTIGSIPARQGNPTLAIGGVRQHGHAVYTGPRTPLQGMIATDSPIDPRSAGGALLDDKGTVVGITGVTPATADGSRMAFATPIEVAATVADDVVKTGRVRHAWLGIDGSDLDPVSARSLGVAGGAVIRVVERSSPASLYALAPGDVITSIDARPTPSMGDVITALRSHHPGDRITLDTHRGGRDIPVTAVLVERPPSAA